MSNWTKQSSAGPPGPQGPAGVGAGAVTVSSKLAELYDPFVLTQIKLIGDSITAGQGGTGYSATGEIIFGGYNANLTTATCWGNMLRDYIDKKFNKDTHVLLDDTHITYEITLSKVSSQNFGYGYRFQNTAANTLGVRFTFYGDHFSTIYNRTTSSGIVDVYVDGVKWGSLDAYGTSQPVTQFDVTGLVLGTHTVQIRETGTKNAASSGYSCDIHALKIPKSAVVKNWGISGCDSQFIWDNRASLIKAEDTVVILQVGTNDRQMMQTPKVTIYNYESVRGYAETLSKKFVAMTASAASVANETDPSKNFRMADLDNWINKYSMDKGFQYISNYKHMLIYCRQSKTDMNTLLADGLHPNDAGYKIMFEGVLTGLGLAPLMDGLSL